MPTTDTGTGAGARGERASGASETIASTFEAGKAGLSRVADSATEAGKQRLDTGIGRAADQVEQVGEALSEAAGRLRSSDQLGGLAAYTGRLADALGQLAERIRTRSVEDLTAEARQAARSNPVLFLAGSVAVGFALTRILKAGRTAGEPAATRNTQPATPAMRATRRAAPAMTGATPTTRPVTAGARAAAQPLQRRARRLWRQRRHAAVAGVGTGSDPRRWSFGYIGNCFDCRGRYRRRHRAAVTGLGPRGDARPCNCQRRRRPRRSAGRPAASVDKQDLR